MREALKVLAGKGLTDARQKRGTFVRERTHWNLLDADVIRWRMETGDGGQLLRDLRRTPIVEPAARTGPPCTAPTPTWQPSKPPSKPWGGPDGPHRAAEADVAFHRALLAATGNELLRRMDMLLEPGLRERDRMVHAHADADDPVPSHRAVLDAIRDRAPARAESAMLDLLAKAAEDLDHLTRAPESAARP